MSAIAVDVQRRPLGVEDFLRQARAGSLAEPPAPLDPVANPDGDHRLNGLHPLALPGRPPSPAAVLVPVVARKEGPTLLLTERASGLRTHSGQIAFPGGRIDATDASPLAAALREAEEEIGLSGPGITPLGYLDQYWSGSGFLVIPVVALVTGEARIAPNPDEVAAVFEVPLAFLMDEANHELHARTFRGAVRQYYAMPYGERYIWGVTAGIIRNLYIRMRAAAGGPPG